MNGSDNALHRGGRDFFEAPLLQHWRLSYTLENPVHPERILKWTKRKTLQLLGPPDTLG